MNAIIEPGRISGELNAPPSKSLTQRALAAALPHKGTTTITNAGNSADERAALHIIKQLGAVVDETKLPDGLLQLQISAGPMSPEVADIDCGESGLAARLFTPIAALQHKPILVSGSGSLLTRPMTGLKEALEPLGIELTSFNGHLPFTVCGPLLPASVKIFAAGSSQLVSGLLMALSSAATAPVTLGVIGLESKPYIDLTLDVLSRFGKPIINRRYREFIIDPAKFTPSAHVNFAVEADWSSAAFLLVAGAIAGSVTVNNLNPNSLQADRRILEVLEQTGANIGIEGGTITVSKTRLQPFEFDATDCPDLFPVLAALATYCKGPSRISGVHRLFHKESNRVESITEMLWSFGVPFSVEEDTLCIEGGDRPHGTLIETYNDHRIVMAAAVCALNATSRTDITAIGPVNKSYPAFFEDMMSCGMNCAFF